ncbi:MAG: VOC family protein [Deltaproteobacteria bacterium]|nr:VOC family protein [Deltaproteobacteria bacterium]
MERVQGIGGVFFKCRRPEQLQRWYEKHLGVPLHNGYVLFSAKAKDQTLWAPFPAKTDYFKPSRAPFIINFRVNNLDRMLAQLRKAKCKVDAKVEASEFGRFGWVMDPEGNRVELWEPPKRKR